MTETTAPDTVKLYNSNDGLFGRRDGGPYLDEVQAKQAEELRAYREGREPNYEEKIWQGSQLVTADQLIRDFNPTHIAGDDSRRFDGAIEAPVAAEVPVEAFHTTDAAYAEDVDVKGEGDSPSLFE